MRVRHGLKHKVRKNELSLKKTMENNKNQKDSTTNISTSNTLAPIRSAPMQTKTGQESEPQGRPKRSCIAYLRDYEVMKDIEIIDEGLVNFFLFAYCDLIMYKEATSDKQWIQAMNEIEKNNTWKITNLLIGKKPIGVKWVYKTKYKLDGKVYLFKVRLIAKGCKQKLGIDYFEVFSQIARLHIIRMIIAFAAQKM